MEDRDADDVRRRMSALQRGWTAGRDQHARQQAQQARHDPQLDAPHHHAPPQSGSEAGTPAADGPGYENEGDGR
ncbi:hypothetical protein [Streptomyces sp. ICC4]|uniref:hypothetical protein n=1 Tax=Streptomyces sp. ICC4 TaxID=2099584 RepID=UPI0013A6C1AC|nr:hypothetical protein [Streptomyces sp. ICC4]